ncbi:MAG: DNA polymerase ligase N-terminal domain-containing protein [Thermodesulfovibrionales bacterium]|nr:DNA polymerase ligase N-terminal domain-containing protein [Thermodesulfovibrionales bacterium]
MRICQEKFFIASGSKKLYSDFMPIFVVHEHHARHLHFDFRLEMYGVLKSWAVPKGHSMNPSDKRLAIMVEDHPLDYGGFEGVIPEGQYGAGVVVIWDKGTYRLLDGNIDSGKIEFELKGKRLKGIFSFIKMKGREKEWLLIKKKDEYADPFFHLRTAIK